MRPPQSGFVQVGLWEVGACRWLERMTSDSETIRRMRTHVSSIK
jgi:hypothetical protein